MSWQQKIKNMPGRAWIKAPGLKVYVRKSHRCLDLSDEGYGPLARTLDLANVEADDPGHGAFTAWFPEFEALAEELNRRIFIESVLNRRLRAWFERHGYRENPIGKGNRSIGTSNMWK